MKLKTITVLLISILAFSSCDKVKDNLEVKDIEFSTPIEDLEVPFGGISDMVIEEGPEVTLDVDINDIVKEETEGLASLDNIREARVTAFKAKRIKAIFDVDLKLFKDIEIWLKAPGFEETKVAWVKGNTNPDEITFEVNSDVDLIDYLKAPVGEKKVILKNIKIGKTGLTKYTLELLPSWKVTVGL